VVPPIRQSGILQHCQQGVQICVSAMSVPTAATMKIGRGPGYFRRKGSRLCANLGAADRSDFRATAVVLWHVLARPGATPNTGRFGPSRWEKRPTSLHQDWRRAGSHGEGCRKLPRFNLTHYPG
jgi:hypothetical protein